jgi:uncharacterized repeat protein (TIGR01451 family)
VTASNEARINVGDDTLTLSTSVQQVADLQITKDDGVTEAVPGETVSYTIVVTNPGPSNVIGATVADTFDAAKISSSRPHRARLLAPARAALLELTKTTLAGRKPNNDAACRNAFLFQKRADGSMGRSISR